MEPLARLPHVLGGRAQPCVSLRVAGPKELSSGTAQPGRPSGTGPVPAPTARQLWWTWPGARRSSTAPTVSWLRPSLRRGSSHALPCDCSWRAPRFAWLFCKGTTWSPSSTNEAQGCGCSSASSPSWAFTAELAPQYSLSTRLRHIYTSTLRLTWSRCSYNSSGRLESSTPLTHLPVCRRTSAPVSATSIPATTTR